MSDQTNRSLPGAHQELSYRLLVQGVTDYAIYMLDPNGRVMSWNAGARRFKGYEAGEVMGHHFGMFYTPEDRARELPQKGLSTAQSQGRFEAEGWRLRKDGSAFWAHVIIDRIHDNDGRFIGFAKITRDCTTQREAAEELRTVQKNLALALEHMARGLALFDENEILILHNNKLPGILGAPETVDFRGKSLRELCRLVLSWRHADRAIQPAEIEELYQAHRAIVTEPEGGEILRQYANDRVIRISHSPIGDGSWVTVAEDITERKRSEARMSYMASHDALTGLPNRASFLQRLDQRLEALAQRPGDSLAVINLDLNRFKEINDTYGHAIGDKVLRQLAQSMTAVLAGDDEFVARFGGDEFAAFKVYNKADALHDFIHRLETALRTKVDIDRLVVSLDASLGVSVYPADTVDRDKLLINADLAMYRAKAAIEEKVCFYEAQMDEAARARRTLAKDIWVAIEQEQFFLHYQVQRSLVHDRITGYEVLLRWRHPTLGLISPATFIPIAEECGAIIPIGEWVLETACRQATAFPLNHRIAINLSPVQIVSTNLVNKVRQVLRDTGLRPDLLELEVTETAIISDTSRALSVLQRIRELGVSIALDDFGTGYSSFQTLRSFPFNKIKIDGSFVNEIESNLQAKDIVRAIIALGRSLGMPVLAECVETRGQIEVLRHEGCAEVQGYLLGPPDELAAVLAH